MWKRILLMKIIEARTQDFIKSYSLISGSPVDYLSLLDMIGDARIVLIGEASHGTHEFYRERTRITQELIRKKGFNAIAVEADWPDAYRVNRYVRGQGLDHNAEEALRDFVRFPSWMWRNTDVTSFVEWLHRYNHMQKTEQAHVGFYGLDLYSLQASKNAVIHFLESVNPQAAERARQRYSCFDVHESEGQRYGHAVKLNIAASCETQVLDQLMELRKMESSILKSNSSLEREEFFFAERNAQIVLKAEQYYRAMYRNHVSSWNLRDTHMLEMLYEIDSYLLKEAGQSKIVVWAHNSHVGDARFTEMSRRGEVNLGQLARELWPHEVFNIGFTTFSGRVTAASEWGSPAERKRVRPALNGSFEAGLHAMQEPLMLIPTGNPGNESLGDVKLERAIGVIYRPESERTSHWFHANLQEQFDVLIHIDVTSALVPLERTTVWDLGEPPETYPSGL